MLLLHKQKIINIKQISITTAQRLKFFLNSERGLCYDGRYGWFENFESARHFRIESESSNSNLNRFSKLRMFLVYGAVIVTKSLWELTRSIWRMKGSTKQPLTFRPSQLNWAVRPHIHHHHLLLLSPKADTYFTIPRRVEGWVNLVTQHAALYSII